MTATTLTQPVSSNQSSTGTTHSKRTVAMVSSAIALIFAASFLISRVATHHGATYTGVPTLSAANAAQIADDVASVSTPVTVQLSPADREIIAGDVPAVTPQLTPADAAQVAN